MPEALDQRIPSSRLTTTDGLLGKDRVNLAGMIVVRPGFRTRLIYRVLPHHGRKNEKKGFRERDLDRDAAHQKLGRADILLVWDNDTSHRDAAMKTLVGQRPWLTAFYLPAHTPTLNPVEGVWSALKRSLANLAPHGVDALAALVKTRLRLMQYRREGLLDGFIAETGLTLEPPWNVNPSSSVAVGLPLSFDGEQFTVVEIDGRRVVLRQDLRANV